MLRYTEKNIVQGLKNEDSKIIRFIYKKYYNSIRSMVLKFNNLILYPDEVFQEGITRVIINLRNNRFNEKSTLFTYLYSICRNICLKEINKNQYSSTINEDIRNEDEYNYEFELIQRLLVLFNKIDDKCRQIIELRFGLKNQNLTGSLNCFEQGIKFNEIAVLLNISTDNARQRFKRCLDNLREIVKSDKLIEELTG